MIGVYYKYLFSILTNKQYLRQYLLLPNSQKHMNINSMKINKFEILTNITVVEPFMFKTPAIKQYGYDGTWTFHVSHIVLIGQDWAKKNWPNRYRTPIISKYRSVLSYLFTSNSLHNAHTNKLIVYQLFIDLGST